MIEQQELHEKRGEFRFFGRIMRSCSGTSHVTVKTTRTTSDIEIALHTSTKKYKPHQNSWE
jgi:hypothetical protein